MGCNMCVVQKPEEQYKVMFQVNGKELSRLSQEQTLEALRGSKDPLVIQVLRRSPRSKGGGNNTALGGVCSAGGSSAGIVPQDMHFVDNGTQTDITFEHIMALGKLRAPSPPLPPVLEPYVLSELPPLDHEYYDPNDYLDGSHHEVDRADELEYEEVELYKSSQQDKLGLTVCYRTDDEEDLGIYVGEVNPNSIAAKDGRIREGDRIIQINGIDVQNREEAVAILTRENSTNISLLLARPDAELGKRWRDSDRDDLLDDLGSENDEEHLRTLRAGSPSQNDNDDLHDKHQLDNACHVNENTKTPSRGGDTLRTLLSNSQELDSGVGRTDESTRNEESSEHDLLGDDQTSTTNTNTTNTPGSLRKFRFGSTSNNKSETSSLHSRDFHFSTDSLLALDCAGAGTTPSSGYIGEANLMMPGLTEEECERYRELLEIKCHFENGNQLLQLASAPAFYRGAVGLARGLSLDVNRNESMEHEMAMLEEELRHLEFKCRNILRAQKMQQLRERCMKAWLLEEEANSAVYEYGSGSVSEPKKHELSDITELPEKSDKDSTSAYNTGESCRSTPLMTDQPLLESPLRKVSETIFKPGPSSTEKVSQNLNRTPHKTSYSATANTNSGSREGSPGKFRSLSRDGDGRRHSEERVRRSPKAGSGGTLERPSCASGDSSPYFSRRHRGGYIPERYQSCMQLRTTTSTTTSTTLDDFGGSCEGSSGHQSPMSLASICKDSLVMGTSQKLGGSPPTEPRMEWKVKVRSDGTRYVAKRPVRDRLLKARAMKIKEERSGMTTDDDAVSEMKMGRYWSKEERKQHLIRAREQRKRREFMMQSRLECLREQQNGEGRNEVSIIALSHKKTMKKRNKKILDNWITIQEMLAHGTRSADGKRIYNPLLSVTTV
ncbi:PDZ domain-containing protein 4 [Polypterus senegalus]|uniref:PDZ domain-containing protein 4 n=1 Tax=Polypterus senegalus TaxID=55291 RepID=UPI001963681B|nr:PDZ domain-containing protein 4 [Polypterus senegalus]XP_039630942.1 PDZ domain-containing protein 4 [Polypterus senegalus]XP_039630943.1 PDZ domain-containing protein 4 [Polypterus senegalus]